MSLKIEGIIPAVLSPYKGYEDTIPRMVEFLVEKGVAALFVTGTFGEGPRIFLEDRMRIIEGFVEAAKGKVPVIVHVGAADLESVRRLARRAGEVGADAVSAVAPFYYRYSLESLVSFYREIAEAAGTGVLVYNNPEKSGYRITVEWFERIASEVPEVVGIKDSGGDVAQLTELAERFGDRYLIAGGIESLIFYNFAAGLHAQVSGLSSIYPEFAIAIHEAVKEGRLRDARRLQVDVNRLKNILSSYGDEIVACKYALKLRGIDLGPPYPPARPLTPEQASRLEKELSAIKPP